MLAVGLSCTVFIMLKTVLMLPVEMVSFQGVVRKAFQGGKGLVVRFIEEAGATQRTVRGQL